MATIDREALKQMIKAQEADRDFQSSVTTYRRSLKGIEEGKGGVKIEVPTPNNAADGLVQAINNMSRAFGHDVIWILTPAPTAPAHAATSSEAQPTKPAAKK